MVSRLIDVRIGLSATAVGVLRFTAEGDRQFSSFDYIDEWRQHPNAFALSPDMPLDSGPFFSKYNRRDDASAFPLPLTDAAPDSWGRSLIRAEHGGEPTELDYLLRVSDFARIGALRFFDEAGAPLSSAGSDIPRVASIADLSAAAHAFQENPERATAIQKDLVGAGATAGGARPKATVRLDAGPTRPNLALVKFTDRTEVAPTERAEVATLNLIHELGMGMVHAEIVETVNGPAALIDRFDRTSDGRRMPYISAQTMLGMTTASGGRYEDLCDAVRMECADVQTDLSLLFDHAVLSITLNNTDNHLKNTGFIRTSAGWELSSFFDVNPQPDRAPHFETTIAGTASPTFGAAISAADAFDLTEDQARSRVAEIAEKTRELWPGYAERAGMAMKDIKRYLAGLQMPAAPEQAQPKPKRQRSYGPSLG